MHNNVERLDLAHILRQSTFGHSQKSYRPSKLCQQDLSQQVSDVVAKASYSHEVFCVKDYSSACQFPLCTFDVVEPQTLAELVFTQLIVVE